MKATTLGTPKEALAKILEALRPATGDDAVSLAVLEVLFSHGSPIIGVTDLTVTTETPVQSVPGNRLGDVRYEPTGAFRTTIELAGIFQKPRL